MVNIGLSDTVVVIKILGLSFEIESGMVDFAAETMVTIFVLGVSLHVNNEDTTKDVGPLMMHILR